MAFVMKRFITMIFVIIILSTGLYTLLNKHALANKFDEITLSLLPDPMALNTYTDGQCTAYAFDKVKENETMIERDWHDAKYWAKAAQKDGYLVNKTPKEGSILQSSRGALGHVAYIEHVYKNGNFKISEMNYSEPFKITSRILTPQDVTRYNIIHPKVNPKQKEAS